MKPTPLFTAAICLAVAGPAMADGPSLVAQAPVPLAAPAGGFDYLVADAANHRIFASHPGAKGAVVIDTKDGSASALDLGVVVNGVAVDRRQNKVYFGGEGGKVLVYDGKTLQKVDEITLDGPGDDIALDATKGALYVDQRDGSTVWVIDTATDKVVGTVTLGGAAEFIAYDRRSDRLYQNVKSTNSVQVIDPSTNAVIATWPTAPATSPHGLAVDGRGGRVFSAGKNGELVAIDISTGKVTASTEIAPGVDQIVYDAPRHRVYCAGAGTVSVVDASDSGLKLLDKIQAGAGTHNLAVDPATGDVWVAYADGDKSYVECLKNPSPAPAQ